MKTMKNIALAGLTAVLIGCGSSPNQSKLEELTITHTKWVMALDESHAAFYGLVYNYGKNDLELGVAVTYTDSSGTYVTPAQMYLHFSRNTGPYLSDPILNPEEELTWATEIVPYSLGIKGDIKVDFWEK